VSSDRMDLDIELFRRDNKYVLIAHRYGVVVRASDLQTGFEELEQRAAIIARDFEEVGLPLRTKGMPSTRTEMRLLDRVAPSLVIIITVGAVLSSVLLLATAPIVNALAGVRTGISELVRTEGSASPTIAALGRSGIDFVIKLSQTLEQVTPERKEELRTAIRKIAREVESIVEDVRPTQQPPSPARPNDAAK
jgi:hypothetical protein